MASAKTVGKFNGLPREPSVDQRTGTAAAGSQDGERILSQECSLGATANEPNHGKPGGQGPKATDSPAMVERRPAEPHLDASGPGGRSARWLPQKSLAARARLAGGARPSPPGHAPRPPPPSIAPLPERLPGDQIELPFDEARQSREARSAPRSAGARSGGPTR